MSLKIPSSPVLPSLLLPSAPARPVAPPEEAGHVVHLHLLLLPLPGAMALTLPYLPVLPRIDCSRRWGMSGWSVPGVFSSSAGVWVCDECSIPVPMAHLQLRGLGGSPVSRPPHVETLLSGGGCSPGVAWGQSDRLPCHPAWWNQRGLFVT